MRKGLVGLGGVSVAAAVLALAAPAPAQTYAYDWVAAATWTSTSTTGHAYSVLVDFPLGDEVAHGEAAGTARLIVLVYCTPTGTDEPGCFQSYTGHLYMTPDFRLDQQEVNGVVTGGAGDQLVVDVTFTGYGAYAAPLASCTVDGCSTYAGVYRNSVASGTVSGAAVGGAISGTTTSDSPPCDQSNPPTTLLGAPLPCNATMAESAPLLSAPV